MTFSNVKTIFPSDIHNVWETVTCLEAFSWRSDLERIEISGKNQFIEYTKSGFATCFTITHTEPYKRWELDMENKNIKGHWIGIFTQLGRQTEINFTEYVAAKKLWMKPFVKLYLKKQQAQYVSDLAKAVKKHR